MSELEHQIELNLQVSFITEGDQIVAYTPALDISTTGKDEAEAKKRFVELVSIFFSDLIENNTVDTVLSELGWKKQNKQWKPPVISQKSVSIRVPAIA